jgi:hypothetical protein
MIKNRFYINGQKGLFYRESYLPKRNGGKRTIYMPSKVLKHYQKKFIRTLNLVFLESRDYYINSQDCVHGFIKNRSVISCAAKHIGYETTLSFDIKDYFDNITYDMIDQIFKEANIKIAVSKAIHFVQRDNDEHTLAQGFASSPILASLYSLKIIRDLIIKLNHIMNQDEYTITMYADDISISTRLTREYEIEDKIKYIVKQTLERHNLQINEKKTRVLRASNGNRRMLGIMVGKDDLYPTQKVKHRLRACKHYAGKYKDFESILDGLTEWSKLRPCKVDKNFVK